MENQIEVAMKPAPLTIVEKNVAAGSCPYLYAWDGRKFRFVTDLLGNSPLGLSLRRDFVLPADPDEFVIVGTDKNFRPRRGCYELEVTEELREVLYLDSAWLVAVDHAPDIEVYSTDKLGPPPFPPSELWALRSRKIPAKAVGDDGIDRTEAVRAVDGIFAPPGPPLPPPLRGVCQPLALTLDFGALDTSRPLVLALTGWIQYGDASVNIASSQNKSLAVIPPKLEVETAERAWQPLDVVIGMPAEKNKTILCDLARKLPADARRLRLTTTFELRWDRIALFERAAPTDPVRHELEPSGADLRFRGFSEIKSRAPGHPQTPAYEKVYARPPAAGLVYAVRRRTRPGEGTRQPPDAGQCWRRVKVALRCPCASAGDKGQSAHVLFLLGGLGQERRSQRRCRRSSRAVARRRGRRLVRGIQHALGAG